ncbi:MAG: Hcp family type VI secretion system effector [Terriglobales bacterium]
MGAVDYFLKIEGIQGESQDAKHKDEIQLESWSFGEQNTGTFATGGGGGAGKVAMQDFHFVKKVDKAGPKLFLACAQGEHIKSALLTCRKAGKDQQEYLKVSFKDILISSYQTSGSGGSDIVPLEQIAFNFAAIKIEYREQKADGTLGGATNAEYNLKQMKAAY